MGRGDLTDEQWAGLEPLLPKGTRLGRPPVWSRRQLIDGIRFRVRTGVPWRDVPRVRAVEPGTTCSADGSAMAPGSGSSPGSSPWPTRRVRSRGT
ncbi:transposase [Streptomyces sp. NPDC002922]|uniref:transposase n=1 Tax=Streptomyces sp. NPDC002922 TaxID=3154439 RepID=UPI0033B26C3D